MKTSFALRKFTVLLALSSLSLTVMNCSKKDDASPENQIVGSWKITNLFVKEGSGAEQDYLPLLSLLGYDLECFKSIVLTFKSDGTLSGSIPPKCQADAEDFIGSANGKYEVKDGKLILTEADGTKSSIDVSFSGNQMIWTSSEVDAGVTTTTRLVLGKQ